MLTTSSEYSQHFLATNRLFVDSCVLIDWASDLRTAEIMERVQAQYVLVFCTVSLLEVGFGPRNQVPLEQQRMALNLYGNVTANVDNSKLREPLAAELRSPGARLAYNPNHHEYLASRTSLMRLMEQRGLNPRNARRLSNDALIYYCAWNSRCPILTHDGDFAAFNEVMSAERASRMLPVFTIQDISRSLDGNEVSFPENLRRGAD